LKTVKGEYEPMGKERVKKVDISKQIRFEFIETRLFWGDGITANEMADTFGISRQSAQAVINQYRRSHPRQMRYDPTRRRHVPTETFSPYYIRKTPVSFLDYLRGQTLSGFYREERGWSDIVLTDVDRLLRPDLPLEPTRTVLSALLQQKVIHINYRSKNQESVTSRLISPNHLVFADNRYHLRAFCHEKHSFLDFVLSRVLWAELTDEEWVSSLEDDVWNTFVTLHFRPNPELSAEAQEAVLKNYETGQSGYRIVKCREAIAYYIKRKMLSINHKVGMSLWQIVTHY